MTATVLSHPHAQLLKRNEKLELLRDIDDSLRELHAADRWKMDGDIRNKIQALADRRRLLENEIREMGAEPWPFNVKTCNSWLVGPRLTITIKPSSSVKLVAPQ